ncbi:MAG: phosphate ABC transporter permease PstA [Deltaproteobacteria bacterium]|nr:phosphate ABC transporter permease PstA [Deltaproteobacteria bacterium]
MSLQELQRGSRSPWPERLFLALCLLAVGLPLLLLVVLVADVAIDALGRLSLDFLGSYPSRHAHKAGILPGLVGSIYLILLTAAVALPAGIGAAVWLEEYAKRGRLSRLIETNIANLAGVPSVIYGILGLGIFVRALGLGRSLVAGALTLALLVLPIVILSTREALRTVPRGYREAAYALGATRWSVVRRVVLPAALPGILTGAILATSRAIGETAPIVVVGALTYVTFLPDGIDAPFTALPIQIFNWVSRPQEAFVQNAAAGILVLLTVMLLMNTVAILLRQRHSRRA